MSIRRYDGIVVGVDGSAESLAALDWAVRAADVHEVPLTVVATYSVPVAAGPGIGDLIDVMRDQAHRAADAARARLAERHRDDAHIEVVITAGDAANELSRRSRTSGMVVVGRRGLGKLDRMVLGSTSSALAAITPGAVTVVPTGAATGDPRRIRVGVDRDEPDVLGASFAEAAVRDCPLEVLHVTDVTVASSVISERGPDASSRSEAAKADLADRVKQWSEKYPQVTCTIVVRHGDAASVLLNGLAPDDLVVLGGRRHPRVTGRVLRSVPDALLRSAPCPVVIAHAQHDPHR